VVDAAALLMIQRIALSKFGVALDRRIASAHETGRLHQPPP